MKKVVEFLQANTVQYLATVGRDGKAKCRPFMFSGEMDGKLWFCTNNTKDVYKDMQSNPEIADRVEQEVRDNMYKLMGGAARPQAKPAEKAVAVSADDFNDED